MKKSLYWWIGFVILYWWIGAAYMDKYCVILAHGLLDSVLNYFRGECVPGIEGYLLVPIVVIPMYWAHVLFGWFRNTPLADFYYGDDDQYYGRRRH